MLRLPEQVGSAEFGVDALVGDDQRLGRPGEEINADAAEQLPLGLGHIGVPWADEHVDRPNALRPDRHRADRLDAAQTVDLVRSREILSRDDGRGRLAIKRRRAGDDTRHARDLGGHDGHVRRGHHRILPARHIGADRIDRDVLMAKHDAGQRLDFNVSQGLPLRLGEVADLRLSKLDVIDVALCELGESVLDLSVGQPEVLAVPAVELRRQFSHRLIAARGDVGQDALDRRAHLRVLGRDRIRAAALLEESSHSRLLSRSSCAAQPYLIACGLIGDPAAPGRCSGGAVKKNS